MLQDEELLSNASDSTIDKIINDVNLAVTKSQRVLAIAKACDHFDHTDIARHDEEIEGGAPQALYKILLCIIPRDDCDDELRNVCKALSLIYSCSEKKLEQSFQQIGEDLLPLLVHVITKCFSGNTSDRDDNESLTNVLGVLNRFNYIPEASLSMAKQPFLLSALLIVTKSEANDSIKALTTEILADLAFHEETAKMMVERPGFMDAINDAASTALELSYKRQIMRVLQNISFSCPDVVSEHATSKLYNVLFSRMKADDIQTRQLSVGTVWNLASVTAMRRKLVLYNDGILLKELVSILRDDDDELRHCAICALKKLPCADTAAFMASCHHLLVNLAHAASADGKLKIRISAAKALRNLSPYIDSSKSFYADYINALARSCSGKRNEVRSIVLDSIQQQSSLESNHISLANQSQLLELFAYILSNGAADEILKIDKVIRKFSKSNTHRYMILGDDLLKSLVNLGTKAGNGKSVVAETFVVESLHHFASLKQYVPRLAQLQGIVEYLVQCARGTTANDHAKLRCMVSETLEILVRSWRMPNENKELMSPEN